MSTRIYIPYNEGSEVVLKNIVRDSIFERVSNQLGQLDKDIEALCSNNHWLKISNKKVYYNIPQNMIVPDINELELPLETQTVSTNVVENWNSNFEGFKGKVPNTAQGWAIVSPNSPFADIFKGRKKSLTINNGTYYKLSDSNSTYYMYDSVPSINAPVYPLPTGLNRTVNFIMEGIIPGKLTGASAELLEQLIEEFKLKTLDFKTADGMTVAYNGAEYDKTDKFMGVEMNFKGIQQYFAAGSEISEENFRDGLADIFLKSDTRRADIEPCDYKRLADINEGHWEVRTEPTEGAEEIAITVDFPLAHGDPCRDVNENGVVGIDFGTRSTIVAFTVDSAEVRLARIGQGKLSRVAESRDYENPTIMEFVSIDNFMKAYNSKGGRPDTLWDDLKVSHTAYSDFCDIKDEKALKLFYSYFYDLKQWCGDTTGKRSVKLIDRDGTEKQLGIYSSMKDGDFDPIELYAYYLGLFINNMRNGIFIDYVMSFPVTYEQKVREKMLSSFEKGLKKSVPDEVMKKFGDRFRVVQGSSEPAAYAICALGRNGYNITPEEGKSIFYGIFDMGGGTTDFDFGVLRCRDPKKRRESRYDYVIERFGAGGDMHLGGENLLELLAYDIFKENADVLRPHEKKENDKSSRSSKGFTFTCPEDCVPFDGGESFIDSSEVAKRNTKKLCEALRVFVENLIVEAEAEDEQDIEEIIDNAPVLKDTFDMLVNEYHPEALYALFMLCMYMEDTLSITIPEEIMAAYWKAGKSNSSCNIIDMELFCLMKDPEHHISLFDVSIAPGTMKKIKKLSAKDDSLIYTIKEKVKYDVREDCILIVLNAVTEYKKGFDDSERSFRVEKVVPDKEKIQFKGSPINLETKSITLDLFDREGEQIPAVKLDADPDRLIRLLSDRIEQGVRNFFKAMMFTEPMKKNEVRNIYVFFAGNATKSPLVISAFHKYINSSFGAECGKLGIDVMDNRVFRLFPPLGSGNSAAIQEENHASVIKGITAPTGKTGVVRGLLDTTVLVLDKVKETGVPFMFYLGDNRCGKFFSVIPAGAEMNRWYPFIDACESDFRVYYTSLAECMDGKMDINRTKLKKLMIGSTSDNEDVNVYIRAVNSNTIEYCVADDKELKNSKYICEPVSVTLD